MLDITNFIAAAGESVKVGFQPLTKIPFLSNWTPGSDFTGSTTGVLNTVFSLSIKIGAMLAIFMFVLGGLQMITARDNASNVGKGKTRMTNAVFGLLMLLSTFVVLNTINPQLTELGFLGGGTIQLDAPPAPKKAVSGTPDDLSNNPYISTGGFLAVVLQDGAMSIRKFNNRTSCQQSVKGGARCVPITDISLKKARDKLSLFRISGQNRTFGCYSNDGGTSCLSIYSSVSQCKTLNTNSSPIKCTIKKMRADTPTKDGPWVFARASDQKFADKELCNLKASLYPPGSTTCIKI